MNKCLVTTLKAHTNNEALSKYNVLTLKIKAVDSPTSNTQYLGIGAVKDSSVLINSTNVSLYADWTNKVLFPYPHAVTSTNENAWYENKDGILEITGKYNLIRLSLQENIIVRVKELYGIPATLEDLALRSIEEKEIDATKLCNAVNLSKITALEVPVNESVTINNKLSKNRVSEFIGMSYVYSGFCSLFDNLGLDDLINNVNIQILYCNRYLKGGNLSSLAKLTNLNTITFDTEIQNNGDIMDFINPWIQAGRTSGKIIVNNLLEQVNITLNGSRITYPSGVQNYGAYLNWTSNGTVTFTAS